MNDVNRDSARTMVGHRVNFRLKLIPIPTFIMNKINMKRIPMKNILKVHSYLISINLTGRQKADESFT